MILSIDYETASPVDIRAHGVYRYAKHPDTKVLLCAYAFDSEPVRQWCPAEFEPIPDDLYEALLDPVIEKHAWNVEFERAITKHVMGVETPVESWRDTMVLALGLSLPGKLLKCCEVMRLPEELRKTDGQPLITRFSVKQMKWWDEKQAEYWQKFKAYNVTDVEAEREVYRRLKKFDLPEHEWQVFAVDRRINERGIPTNMRMCRSTIRIRDALVSEYLAEMNTMTGLDNSNSVQQLLPWLQEQGYAYDDCKASHIRDAFVHGSVSEDCRRVLWLRQQVSRISTKKFDAIESHVDDDGRIRGTLQMNGAKRTQRWGGRVVQPQNLPRPVAGLDSLEWGETEGGNPLIVGGKQIELAILLESGTLEDIKRHIERPMDAIAGATRTVIQAPDGYLFVVYDWSAIENVILGWLSGDDKILDVFRKGLDPYIAFAVHLYRKRYSVLLKEYKDGNRAIRQDSKPPVLGCGYMLGPGQEETNYETGETIYTGLRGYAENMGISLSQEMAEHAVKTWRETYDVTVDYWYELQRAAMNTVRRGTPHEAGRIGFDIKKPFLRMHLPSGRCLHYLRPRVEPQMKWWGKTKDTLTYEGEDSRNYQWTRISTHPGKIMENADQGTAREILAHALVRLEELELYWDCTTVLHVHDEVVNLVREDQADEVYAAMGTIMKTMPEWASDLPLDAHGYISKYFVKD